MDDRRLLEILDTIYACGAGQKPWTEFVKEYEKYFPCLRISIAGYDAGFKDLNFFLAASLPEKAIQDFSTHYYKINPWEKIVQALPAPPEVAWVHDYLPTDELVRTPFYNEFLKPLDDIATGFGSVLIREDDRFLNFQANLSFKHIDEGMRAAEYMRVMGPHLVRAFELYRRLGAVSLHAGTMEAALNHTAKPVFIIDDQFRLHFANKLAENLLRNGSVVGWKTPDRLEFANLDDERAVKQQMAIAKGETQGPTYFRLRTPHDNPCAGFLTRLRLTKEDPIETARGTVRQAALYIFIIISAGNGLAVDKEAIRAVLGVTSAEAALAQGLIGGLSLREYSEAAGISYHTARSHMKSLIAKTDTANQTSLVQMLTEIFCG